MGNCWASSVRDGNREYLGPEGQKVAQARKGDSPRTTGWEGQLGVMSIEDVRSLLNKSE